MSEKAYTIRDINGRVVALHVRIDPEDGGDKSFNWYQPDGTIGLGDLNAKDVPLYNSESIASFGGDIIMAEGEKATDALTLAGHHAVGTVTGAAYIPNVGVLRTLRGHKVILWPDNDDVGRKHMTKLSDALHNIGVQCSIIDVHDLNRGGDAADCDEKTMQEFIDKAVVIQAEDAPDQPQMWGSEDIAIMYADEITRRMKAKEDGRRANLNWGFDKLDAITDGLHPGLICLHAPPGAGKSAFALQIAAQVEAPVLYVTAEMGLQELARRLVARISRIPRRTLMSANLSTTDEMEHFNDAINRVPNLHFMDATTTPAFPDYIDEQLEHILRADVDGHGLLIIDSLHSWIGPMLEGADDNEYKTINRVLVSLRDLVTKYQIPILFIAERNRASMKEGGLSAVAGSRAPEYRSDIVLSLDLEQRGDDDTEEDLTDERVVWLSILKNRQGANGGRVGFKFNGEYQRFGEME